MLAIPREEFIPAAQRANAYVDAPLPIGYGQTITQPYMTALMAQSLELSGGKKVLDIGTGSGYHAAILGALAHRVISIERIPRVGGGSARYLKRTGLDSNVTVLCVLTDRWDSHPRVLLMQFRSRLPRHLLRLR